MIRDGLIFYVIGMVVGGAIAAASITRPEPEHRALIVCHADGTTFVGHVDTQGISQADLTNAVQIMCRFKERMGV